MPCLKLAPGTLVDVRNLQGAANTLGLFKGPIPQKVFPEGSLPEDFPYLTGTDHQTFDLNPLYVDGEAKLNCVLNTLGYNPTRAEEIVLATKDLSDTDYSSYMANLPASDALIYDTYKTLGVVKYFRTDAVRNDISVGGNKDSQMDRVSTDELNSWAWEASGHNEEAFFQAGGDVVARLHALERLGIYLNAAPTEEPGLTIAAPDAGVPVDAAQGVILDAGVDSGTASVGQFPSNNDGGQTAKYIGYGSAGIVGAAVFLAVGRAWGRRGMKSTIALAMGAANEAAKGPQAGVPAQMVTPLPAAPAPAVVAPSTSPAMTAIIASIPKDDQGSPGGTS